MNHLEKNISEFGKQLTEKNITGFNLKKLSGVRPDGIVIVGIGGSTLVGDVLKGIQEEIGLSLPIVVWKDYGIPKRIQQNLQVVARRRVAVEVERSCRLEDPMQLDQSHRHLDQVGHHLVLADARAQR